MKAYQNEAVTGLVPLVPVLIEYINGHWYVFYHRHTNAHSFSRQACLEPIEILPDGTIPQVARTSSGPSGAALPGEGMYPGYMACNLFGEHEPQISESMPGKRQDTSFPYITQDGVDGDENPGYVANIDPGAGCGFKYFACQGTQLCAVTTRGYCLGSFELALTPDGTALGSIQVGYSNEWKTWRGSVAIPDGVHALYLRYTGMGFASLHSFTLEKILG